VRVLREIVSETSIKVAFSPACNFRCEYCGGGRGRKGSPYPAAMEDYRATSLKSGRMLNTDEMTNCLRALATAGFKRIRPTGGEPTLNPEWDLLVERANEIGFSVDITTNGSRLNSYLDKKKKLPNGLSMVKVGLDTPDPIRYHEVNGGRGDLKDVERAIVRVLGLGMYVRLNTVLTRSGCGVETLKNMMEYSESLGVQQVQLLDLVYYPNYPSNDPEVLQNNKSYWENQFVSFNEFRKIFRQAYPNGNFSSTPGQFGVDFWKTTLPSGLVVTFKDSTSTMRDEKCFKCPVFCQEGRCLLRLGTDGNLTPCPDYRSELPDNFNVLDSVRDATFNKKINVLVDSLVNSKKTRTIEMFARVHGLKLPEKV